MTMIAKFITACALFCSALANACEAGEHAHDIDVIALGTHIVAIYLKDRHKAGDVEAQFIEDIVIPAVGRAARNDNVGKPPAFYDSLLAFLVMSQQMASEEISAIASEAYQSRRKEFCAAFVRLEPRQRQLAATQVQSGFASTGRQVPSDVCK